jgi:NAD(P)-dependent dehydrogenase (short-subunit alcohol dehydrogenase family)
VEVPGRVAVVTGAAVGTGRAIAVALAAAGAEVVVTDIDAAGGEETVRLARPGHARFVELDMLDAAQVIEFIRSTEPLSWSTTRAEAATFRPTSRRPRLTSGSG